MKSEVLDVLKVMTATLSRLTDQEVEKLVNGEAKLVYSENKVAGVERGEKVNPTNPLIAQLKETTNRGDATRLLSRKGILKKDLIDLATVLNIHINKSSNKAKIIEKIVEATVGVTLRSNAIKETSIGRK
ncbi:hypothetical protein J2S74_000332 [Evansella vedderi]|uniref:Uncharacterized protein n=1 Tax=Evansella vedderi TaxID=38282 RepID=A0ABT9ZNZ2_9BACI|nr:hypothetical protein [Evansella vedderi]MDQ0252960.1 hypothetical protein [Evansella vedderi]